MACLAGAGWRWGWEKGWLALAGAEAGAGWRWLGLALAEAGGWGWVWLALGLADWPALERAGWRWRWLGLGLELATLGLASWRWGWLALGLEISLCVGERLHLSYFARQPIVCNSSLATRGLGHVMGMASQGPQGERLTRGRGVRLLRRGAILRAPNVL